MRPSYPWRSDNRDGVSGCCLTLRCSRPTPPTNSLTPCRLRSNKTSPWAAASFNSSVIAVMRGHHPAPTRRCPSSTLIAPRRARRLWSPPVFRRQLGRRHGKELSHASQSRTHSRRGPQHQAGRRRDLHRRRVPGSGDHGRGAIAPWPGDIISESAGDIVGIRTHWYTKPD